MNDTLSLQSMVTPQTARARVSVESRDEVIEAVGQLLVDAGKITPDYIQAMKDAFVEMGPYSVIAPGIVLLHARPENGVLEPCLALITLANPIEFGHSENDPVEVAVAFGATDKEKHITALMQLADLLGNEQVMEEVKAAATDEDLLAAVRSYSTG